MLALCACLHALITCIYGLTRLYTYKTSLLDTGTFDQVLWNLLHHGWMLSTTNPPFNDQNWLGFHFSPILLLAAPPYALWPHPELLQGVQSACFGLAGIALFHALSAAGAKPKEAWAGAILYWCNPFVLGAALWDFHEIAFATLLVALALWALCAGRFTALVACLVLLLLTKEHYGISVAGFGFLWGRRYGQWRRGLALMALGALAMAVIILFIMPALNGGAPHPMWTHATSGLSRYGWLREPWERKIGTFLHLLLVSGGGAISGISYLFMLLLSGFMLPLAAPVYLLAAGSDLAANLLSANPMPRHWAAYHSAPIIPVVLVSAYLGYARMQVAKELRRNHVYQMVFLLTCLFYCNMMAQVFRVWELGRPQLTLQGNAGDAIAQMTLRIPPGAVSAQSNIGSFFAQREAIYPFPYVSASVNTVLLRLALPFASKNQDHFGIPLGITTQQYRADAESLLHDPAWHIAYWQPPWLMLVRTAGKPEGTPASQEAMRRDAGAHLDALFHGEEE